MPEAQSAVECATFLRTSRDEIITEWAACVRRLPHARALERPRLIDHVPQLLSRIADLVERGDSAEEALQNVPEIHALDRLDVGYDLGEVTAEYAELRRCLTRVWARAGRVDPTGLERLNEAIDRAVQVAVTGYARARQRTLEGLERLSALAIGSGLDLDFDAFLRQLLAMILETTESVDTAVILLREGEWLRTRAAVGLDDDVTNGFRLRMGEGFAGRVAAEARSLAITHAAVDPVVKSEAIRRRGVLGLYGVPLQLGSGVIGVALFGSLTAREFGEDDQTVFRALAGRASAVIERRRVEATLRASEEHLRLAVDATGLGTFDWNVTTGALHWSERTRSIFGVGSSEPVTHETFLARVHPDDRDRVRRDVETLIRSPDDTDVHPTEYRIVLPEGAERWVAVHARVRRVEDADGLRRVVRLTGTVVDQTQQRQREDAMRRAQEELRVAVRARDEVLGVVSHDLRNALQLVGLSAQQLRRAPELGAYEQRTVDRIDRGVTSMARIIGDLLDVAAIEAGQLTIRPSPFPVAELVVEASERLRPLAQEKGVSLEVDVTGVGSARALLDRERMLQVLGNLVSNAVKFTPEGGRVRVVGTHDQSGVRLSVHDTGVGIAREDLARVFQRGFRGGDKRGLGFGLSIARGIVQAHGGTLHVESTPGDGSTFSVTLPAA